MNKPSDALFLVIMKSLLYAYEQPYDEAKTKVQASDVRNVLDSLGYSDYKCSYIKDRINHIGGNYRRVI